MKAHIKKWQRIALLGILGYEGAGCLVGGSFLIAAPDGRLMEMPVDIMHGTFNNFFIPGVILFSLGVLTVISFFAVLRRNGFDWFMAYFALGGLAIWFWVEIAILQEFHWLHAMWGLPIIIGGIAAIAIIPPRHASLAKAFLICGILSSLFYVALNIFVPMQWPEYSSASQTVSELSAVGAPTQPLWVWLGTLYTVLVILFSWGVWRVAEGNRKLRTVGALLIAYGALGVFWPLAPMHLRETLAAGGGTFSDTMHLTLGAVTEVIYLVALAVAAGALGKGFRIYSIITFIILFIFGMLTFLDAPNVSVNQPTPLIGVWERINIGVFLLWVISISIILLRKAEYKSN